MKLCLAPLTLSVGLLALVAGCGAQAPDTSGTGEDDLSASKKSFVSVTADQRKCASPMCGGFFVQDLNKTTQARYVASLDFSKSQLTADDIDSVLAAPPEEVVLYGKLGKLDQATQTRPFVVTDVYLGLPGVSVPAGATFFTTKDRSPAIQCFTAPCNNVIATRVNATPSQKPVDFTRAQTSSIQVTELDHAWLDGRVETAGAIVAGSLVKGQALPGGSEVVLDAAQVFVKLPEGIGPCPTLAAVQCPANKVMSFTRDARRCLLPDQCVTPKVCNQAQLACSPGYHDVPWKTAAHACNAHACDPDFAN